MSNQTTATLDAWLAAREATPTDQKLAELASTVEQARALLADAETEWKRAQVQRACVYGWTEVAESIGVKPRTLHGWHRTLAADVTDLSAVPAREEARAHRAAARAQAAREAAEQAAREAEARARQFADRLAERRTTEEN